jgi:Septum formation
MDLRPLFGRERIVGRGLREMRHGPGGPVRRRRTVRRHDTGDADIALGRVAPRRFDAGMGSATASAVTDTDSYPDAGLGRPGRPAGLDVRGATGRDRGDLRRSHALEHPDGLEGYAPPPVAKEPLWKRLPLGLIVIGFFIAAGAVGGLIFNASRGESGEITKTGDLAATDLRAGDCFDLKDPSAEEIGDVTGIPCTAEHEYETFFIGTMPEGPFPNDDGFIAWLDGNCRPAFETYVGMAYENSELDIFWLQPTSEAWNDGDRSIQCALYHPRIHRLTESLKGSAR